MDIYIGNLSLDTTEEQLRELFSGFGRVGAIHIQYDKISKRPLGFAFIAFPDDDKVAELTASLDRTIFNGRKIIVREMKRCMERRCPKRRSSDAGCNSHATEQHQQLCGQS